MEVSSLEKESVKVMARNREAYHEYFVEEEFEAGIELCGTEVKSIRQGTLNLKDAWCGIKNGELILNQMHISPYDHGNRFNQDPRRPRRLGTAGGLAYCPCGSVAGIRPVVSRHICLFVIFSI